MKDRFGLFSSSTLSVMFSNTYSPSSNGGGGDARLFEELRDWFLSIGSIRSVSAESYAKKLLDGNITTIDRLKKRLLKEPDYLELVLGMDEDDADDVRAKITASFPSPGRKEHFVSQPQQRFLSTNSLIVSTPPSMPDRIISATKQTPAEEIISFLVEIPSNSHSLAPNTIVFKLNEIASFLKNNQAVCEELIHKDTCVILLELLNFFKNQTDKVDLVGYTLVLIKYLIQFNDSFESILRDGVLTFARNNVCEEIIVILNNFIIYPMIVEWVCRILLVLLVDPYCKAQLATFSSANLLVKALSLGMDHNSSQNEQMTLWILCVLDADSANTKYLRSNNGVFRTMNAVLAMHLYNPLIVGKVYRVLEYLCDEGVGVNALNDARLCGTINTSINYHMNNHEVVDQGLSLLITLLDGNNEKDALLAHMFRESICSSLVTLVARYKATDENIVANITRMLTSFSQIDYMIAEVGNSGVGEALVDLLPCLSYENKLLICDICQSFRCLMSNNSNKLRLENAHVGELLCKFVRDYAKEKEVIKDICRALRVLFIGTITPLTRNSADEICSALTSLLNLFLTSDKDIGHDACDAIESALPHCFNKEVQIKALSARDKFDQLHLPNEVKGLTL